MKSGARAHALRRASSTGLLMAWAVLAPLSASAAEPPESDPQAGVEQAVALHDEARQLYQRGKYREAIAKLNQAVDLDPEGKELYYNLGLIHEKIAEYGEALAHFERCRALEDNPDEQERLDGIIDRIRGAKKAQDEQRKNQPPPPPPPPPPESPGLSTWTYVAGGVAISSLVVGGVFGGIAAGMDPGADASTGDGVTVDDLSDDASTAHGLAVAADVFFILGGVAAGATLVLALTTEAEPDEREAPSADQGGGRAPELHLGVGRAALRWQW
jgi:tetratricopeptide (TPR) repeat protein